VSSETDTATAVAERAATAVYVYGVTGRGAAPPAVTGLSEQHAQVRAIEGGELTALVSDVPAQWHAASRQDVAAHDRVLSELMRVKTVVPMRFGIVLASDAAVRERLLQRHAAELSELVARLEGCEQMSVKAYYEDEGLLRAVLARRPELKRRADALERLPVAQSQGERIALGQDVAAAVEEQRALDERALVEPLAALAEETQVDPGASDRHLATVQLLVKRDRRAALDAAVQRLAQEHAQGIVLRYVGPLPPYSFCAFALEAEPA
jgi:gas vesicle protein GvpL/GvpF